mgnify:CR=1 FL=1
MYAIKQFYLKLFNAKTTMKDKTMMCDETKNECCNHADPPWEGPQVIPAQIRRVDNLIFRKINQFARENDVEQATPMHGWIIGYLYRHRDTPVFQRDIEREFSITRSTVTNILQLMERQGVVSSGAVFRRTPGSSSWYSPKRASASTKRRCSASTRPTTMWPDC